MASNIALTGLAHDLDVRAKSGKPIRIGLIGSGEMGTDIVTRVRPYGGHRDRRHCRTQRPGRDQGRGHRLPREVAIRAKCRRLRHERRDGSAARSPSPTTPDLVINNDLIDVVIDATGIPAVGAEIGLRAMEHGKHLVMMNVEADVTIGAYLKSEADRLGVTYSLGAGDEPPPAWS